MVLNIILWLIFGGFIGWIAGLIVGTNEKQGVIGDIVVGLIGSFLGGIISYYLTGNTAEGINVWSFVWATVGAVILLLIVRAVSRTKNVE